MDWDNQKAGAGGGSNSQAPPEGNHPAVCVAMLDLGIHTERYQGGDESDVRHIAVVWELGIKPGPDGPYVFAQQYNWPADANVNVTEKNKLRQHLQSWRGKKYGDDEPIQLSKILGRPCLLNLSQGKSKKGNAYAEFQGIGPLPTGMAPPKPTYEPFLWSVSKGGKPDSTALAKLPDWLPYLYGKSMADIAAHSHELGGKPAPGSSQADGYGDPPSRSAQAVTAGAPAGDDDIPF